MLKDTRVNQMLQLMIILKGEWKDNVLFLTVMNKNKNELYVDEKNNIIIFKKIYDWFRKTLTIIFPNKKLMNDSYYASEENLEKITEIVSKFGTGISKCKTEIIKPEELGAKIPPEILNEVMKFTETNFMNVSKQISREKKVNTFLRLNNELFIFEKKDR